MIYGVPASPSKQAARNVADSYALRIPGGDCASGVAVPCCKDWKRPSRIRQSQRSWRARREFLGFESNGDARKLRSFCAPHRGSNNKKLADLPSSHPPCEPEWTESSVLDGVHGGLRPEPQARERRTRSESRRPSPRVIRMLAARDAPVRQPMAGETQKTLYPVESDGSEPFRGKSSARGHRTCTSARPPPRP